jgi:hypothetical protein
MSKATIDSLAVGFQLAGSVSTLPQLSAFMVENEVEVVDLDLVVVATLPAPGPLEILTDSLPDASWGEEYSVTLQATGGVPPYTWSISAGSLPTGLSLTGALVSGIPTAPGTFDFTIQVTDSLGMMMRMQVRARL